MRKKQLSYIDIARGIGILLVVIGHCITKEMASHSDIYKYLRLYIYTIHMPLFFILAGYLFENNLDKYNESPPNIYCKAKINAFAIPYISLSIINYVIINIAMKIPKISSILSEQGYHFTNIKESIFQIITYIGHQDNHLWFSYVMLLVLIINRVLLNKKIKFQFIFLFILYFSAYSISSMAPEVIFKTMRYLLLFYIGRRIFELRINPNKNIIIFATIVNILGFIGLCISLNQEYMYIYPILCLLTEVTASIIIIFGISYFISNKKLATLFEYFGKGKNSYIIYLLHMPFITPFIIFILQKINIPTYSVIIIGTVLSIIICIYLYKIVISKSLILCKLLGMDNKRELERNINTVRS